MQIVKDILRPFGTTTIIQGRVIALHGNDLDIETAAGTVLLQRNPSTRMVRLLRIDAKGFQFEDLSWSELDGHYCVCRVMAYSLPSDSPSRRHTLFSLISFGPDRKHLLGNPDFHCHMATWLAMFWLSSSLDTEAGGVFTNILNGGVLVSGTERNEKWSYITSRAVAGFTFAFQLTGEIDFLQAATHAMTFLKKSTDEIEGHLFFRSRQLRDGTPHPAASPLLNIFVHEYALTGPLRYLAATGDTSTRHFVNRCLESLMLFHDPNHGGFFDALKRTTLRPISDATSTKSFTSSADLLAAAIIFAKELNCFTQNFDPRSVAIELCEIIVHHHLTEGRPFIMGAALLGRRLRITSPAADAVFSLLVRARI